jgi:hypothetical protein
MVVRIVMMEQITPTPNLMPAEPIAKQLNALLRRLKIQPGMRPQGLLRE